MRIGPYTLVQTMGGDGSTWTAKASGGTLALRLAYVDDTAAHRLLLHECASGAQFDHPHIARIHECGQSNGICWLALGLRGEPGAPLTLANFRQLLLALLHVHGNDVVHGDIRPANLFIAPEGELMLADFRHARKAGQAASQEGGRSEYASPEQHLGDVLDSRADIYSAGAVLYELLTRVRPAGARPTAPSILAPGLGNNFDAVVARALAPEKAARFAHVFEFLVAFDAACQRGVRSAPADAS